MKNKININNLPIILIPITEEEKEILEDNFQSIYVLYKKEESNKIEVGIPDLEPYYPLEANMVGYDKSLRRGYFYNGNHLLEKQADCISDRPVFKVIANDKRQVSAYSVLNKQVCCKPIKPIDIYLKDGHKINPYSVTTKLIKAMSKTAIK